MTQEIKETITLTNELGLHARAAASFVKTANKFNSDITVMKEKQEVNGKSIFGLMMLAAPKGSCLDLVVTGEDAEDCLGELKKLVCEKFGEEQ